MCCSRITQLTLTPDGRYVISGYVEQSPKESHHSDIKVLLG
jgi:hypothetical protein